MAYLNPTDLPVGYVPDPQTPSGSVINFTGRRALSHATFQLYTAAAAAAVPANQAQKLHDIPAAGYAMLVLEAAPGAVAGAVLARYWLDADLPTATEGFPIKDGEMIEITSQMNLKNFRIMSADDLAHTIQIQYFTA